MVAASSRGDEDAVFADGLALLSHSMRKPLRHLWSRPEVRPDDRVRDPNATANKGLTRVVLAPGPRGAPEGAARWRPPVREYVQTVSASASASSRELGTNRPTRKRGDRPRRSSPPPPNACSRRNDPGPCARDWRRRRRRWRREWRRARRKPSVGGARTMDSWAPPSLRIRPCPPRACWERTRRRLRRRRRGTTGRAPSRPAGRRRRKPPRRSRSRSGRAARETGSPSSTICPRSPTRRDATPVW